MVFSSHASSQVLHEGNDQVNWIQPIITAAVSLVTSMSGKALAVAGGIALVLLGVIAGSTAMVVFGGAVILFVVAR